MKKSMLLIALFFFAVLAVAQAPLDDIVERRVLTERRVLPYPPLRESDIFWEKRVWRVIDVNEKMNQTFMYPPQPFFTILSEAALQGDIRLYSTEDDAFSFPLHSSELNGILYFTDTITILDPETGDMELKVVTNSINYEDIKRFRLKEVWFFDAQRSVLNVRILGLAPVIEVYDDFGNVKYEKPLFWVNYAQARDLLSRFEVFNAGNDHNKMSWEDLLEMRFFSSTIYKASNIHDRRIQEYLSGLELLQEADKIKQELFNFEHDLWSY